MKKLLLFFVAVSITWASYAQLSGTFTIDPTQPYAGYNFQSFDVAIMVLNSQGINGPIVFNVKADAVFEENVRIITTTGTSTNTITFQKDGTGANPIIKPYGNGVSNDAGIYVYKGSYFTFDGIDVQSPTGNVDIEYGYYFMSADNIGCKNNIVKNCTITLEKANMSSFGIRIYSFGVTDANGINDNNLIQNVTIQNAAKGISIEGNSTYYDNLNHILNCNISNIGIPASSIPYFGIGITYQNQAAIEGCIIDNVAGASTTSATGTNGIYMNYGTECSVSGVDISNINGAVTTGITFLNQVDLSIELCNISNITGSRYTNGIYSNTGATNTVEITACTIDGIEATGATLSNASGIYLTGGTSAYIAGNTIRDLTCAVGASTNIQAIYVSYTTELVIEGNKISNLEHPGTTSSNYANGVNMAGNAIKYVYNNLIYDLSAPGSSSISAVCGLRVSGEANTYFWYNTVYLNHTPTAANISVCAYIGVAGTVSTEFKNNIFINKSDVSTIGKASVFVKTATSVISTATDKNIYYSGTSGANNIMVYIPAATPTIYETFEAYKAAFPDVDVNSYYEDVPFISTAEPYNFSISTTECTNANNNAIRLPVPFSVNYIDFDIDGAARSITTPDIGAYEFDGYELTALAEDDKTICENNTTISANSPAMGATGVWAVTSGAGNIVNSTLFSSNVTDIEVGTNTYRWTVSKDKCKTVFDDLEVTYVIPPTAIAGDDDEVCGNSYTLQATDPSPNTGFWTIVSGAANITNPVSNNTTVNDASYGQVTFRWNVDNGCIGTDDVTITFDQPVTATTADDDDVCGNEYILIGNTPITGIGTWSTVDDAVIADASLTTTSVLAQSFGVKTFTWTIVNGECEDSDDITIDFIQEPIANFDYIIDNLQVDFTNNSEYATSYSWDFGDATGTSTEENPTYTYSVAGNYDVVLTAYNGICENVITIPIELTTSISDFNDNKINIYPNPTSGKVTVNLPNFTKPYKVSITDISGKTVVNQLSIVDNKLELDLSQLSKGIYTISIISENEIFSQKLIVK